MFVPVLRGRIERRILVNFRLDPEVMQRFLPEPFRVQRVRGYGLAGICLIRMSKLRPRFLPFSFLGTSENAALRFAVEWEDRGELRTGVYIPERFTTSSFAALAGGRFFPGVHYKAKFRVEEKDGTYDVEMNSKLKLKIQGRAIDTWPWSEVFDSLDEASAFYRGGAVGYSDALGRAGKFEGIELRIADWSASALRVQRVECDFFDDRTRYPEGSVHFDNALLMRDLVNEFRGRGSFCCDPRAAAVQREALSAR